MDLKVVIQLLKKLNPGWKDLIAELLTQAEFEQFGDSSKHKQKSAEHWNVQKTEESRNEQNNSIYFVESKRLNRLREKSELDKM